MMDSRAALMIMALVTFTAPASAQTRPTAPPAPPQLVPRPDLPSPAPTPYTQLQSEFAVAAGDTVLFPYQSNDLTPRSVKILENQAKWLKTRPEVKVTLEAYCDDDIDPKQARAFCLTRARTVRDYFVRHGIATERVALIAFDDIRTSRRTPAKADDKKSKKNEKARRTNRRVTTRVSL